MARPEDEEVLDSEVEEDEDWDEDDSDEDSEDEEEIEEGEGEDEDDKEESEDSEEELAEEEVTTQAAAPTPVVSVHNIPFDVTVEVGRLKLTAKQLMSMGPGTVMDLNIDPEGSLDLVANGACIGRGELIRVGDVLGVRVLNMG